MSSWFFEPLHLWRYIILQCLWLMHQKNFLGRARWKSPTTEAATQGMSHRADTRVCQLSWSSENHELCVRICFEGPESEPVPQQSQMHVTQEKQLTRQSTTFKNIPPRIESLFLRLFAETLQTCCLRGFSFLSLHHLAAHLTEPVLPVRDHLKVTVTLLAWAPTDKHLSRLFSQITDESFPLSATSRSTEWHLEIASCFRKS